MEGFERRDLISKEVIMGVPIGIRLSMQERQERNPKKKKSKASFAKALPLKDCIEVLKAYNCAASNSDGRFFQLFIQYNRERAK